MDDWYCEHKSNPNYCPHCTTEKQRESTREKLIECPSCIDGFDWEDMPCTYCGGSGMLDKEKSIKLHNVRFMYWNKKSQEAP
jgi:hypothetical protein